ncbi:DUF5926 family protein [Nocardioides rotundus]|uniref:DUF5926 family protein n=1 Tax=Nocardioides rotundus TaxID=1774216 RepID=UPI001CBC4D9B|nr:DUF5926 family protein [Nocardioides rotundus]UAL29637.1 DUF5926 family protein [Nocardioides rotundus]
MGKRSRTKTRDQQRATDTVGEVGPRQPCPCGSGKRYKACHGAPGGAELFVRRPFEGIASEGDLVALRELVPAATAPVRLRDADRTVTLATLLPGATPALVRDSGEILLGLQVMHSFGDPARDLGAVLERALEADPGPVGLTGAPGDGPRIQDLLVLDEPLDITVHEDFAFWLDEDQRDDPAVRAALEQANSSVQPAARLTQVEAAWWADVGTKEHLRWVMPEPEGELLDALARLHAAGDDVLVPDSRLVGMFRAHGLLCPVWDLPVGTGPEALEDPAADFRAKLDRALADGAELTAEERSARSGLAQRQVTIRPLRDH